MIAVISTVVVAVLVIGYFVLRPAPPEQVKPRPANQTRMGLLKQGLGQGQPPAPGNP
jgi:energy-converting hydrogenase Eha subunit F